MFQGQYAIIVTISQANVDSATTTKPAICFAIEDMISTGNLDGVRTAADKTACSPVTAEYLQTSDLYAGRDGLIHYTKVKIAGYEYSIDSRDEPKLLAEFLGVKPIPYQTVLVILP